MKRKSRLTRCAMLAVVPVRRLSMPDDRIAPVEQRFGEVGSDESGGAGDDGSRHGG
jgi:hypothetical protein